MVFFGYDYTVIRKEPGKWIAGKWVEGAETQITVNADIQPVSGYELQSLEVNRKEDGMIKIITTDSLVTLQETKDQNPDVIIFEGKEYEIVLSMKNTWLLAHEKYFARLRVNNDA